MGYVVLVVEDEVIVRMVAVQILEDAGFVAIEAKDADTALRQLNARSDVDLVFTDVDMPGAMDGQRMAYAISAIWPRISLLVVSGKSLLALQELPDGARFLAKPYDPALLVDIVREMLCAPRAT